MNDIVTGKMVERFCCEKRTKILENIE